MLVNKSFMSVLSHSDDQDINEEKKRRLTFSIARHRSRTSHPPLSKTRSAIDKPTSIPLLFPLLLLRVRLSPTKTLRPSNPLIILLPLLHAPPRFLRHQPPHLRFSTPFGDEPTARRLWWP